MERTTSGSEKRFFQNDRLLVCSMLVFYGLCMLGLISATAWWLTQRGRALSVSATATAYMMATQQAQSTAAAAAYATELAQYELIDRFDSNKNQWRVGAEAGEYWTGSTQITSGVYIWDVRELQDNFAAWADSPSNVYIKNYDAYVDTQIVEAPAGNPCSGLIFRKAPLGWNTGGYSFMLCKAGYFTVHYHNLEVGWQEIHPGYHPSIQPSDWNRLEVRVDGSHFVFLINSQTVYEMDDDRQPAGGVALLINVDEAGTKILFDNFGYQSR